MKNTASTWTLRAVVELRNASEVDFEPCCLTSGHGLRLYGANLEPCAVGHEHL